MLVSFLWLSVVNRPSYFLSFISGFFFLDSNKIKEKKAINRPAANNNKIKAVEEVCSRWREIEKQEYYRHLLPWFYFSGLLLFHLHFSSLQVYNLKKAKPRGITDYKSLRINVYKLILLSASFFTFGFLLLVAAFSNFFLSIPLVS